jgi:hypothetical protein
VLVVVYCVVVVVVVVISYVILVDCLSDSCVVNLIVLILISERHDG